MISLIRTDASHADYQELVRHLDADLRIRDGEDHAFYAQFNKSDDIRHVILAYENDMAVGCGAIKAYTADTMEVKRMYVPPEMRGKGIAAAVLQALESWAGELGFRKCILETGIKQPEAIGLYKKCGYTVIPNYGQYAGVDNSVCFEKIVGE
jgi:putative acetyltransferase